ncbi:LIC_13387 family protein [Nocardioides allogilvus]|uniref:LIC_13387 family protein n=1 Tax=Nocardioides allogilvus TaxID=2072017 RepID=UPI000D301778|nr:hypothetical protein [Nocardioides allogilvus]
MTTRTLRSTCTALIGWLLVITGAGHTTLVAIGSSATPSPEEREVRALMAATSIPVAGMERSYWDLYQGMSLMMALMLVGLGALVLLVRRRAPGLVEDPRTALLLAVVLVPAVALSVLLLPPPPMVLLGLAALAAVVALVRGPRQLERPGGERHEQLAISRDQADAGTAVE